MAVDWWQEGASIYAAIVATGALFLEIRRWFESGPRLKVTIICPAIQVGGAQEDDRALQEAKKNPRP
jgi:hypothetical protein